MNPGLVIFGLLGVGFCSYKVYGAWKGGGNIPIGTIVGGALGGMGGAMAGSGLAGDNQPKPKPKPNWGGLVFWGFVWLVWFGMTLGGLFGSD